MNTINISTGRKEIAIKRDGVDVGSVFFSPSDASIIKRIREVQDRLKDINVELDTEELDAALGKADEVDKQLRDAIDYAFDYPCSEVVFGAGYSFTTAKGVSAVQQFLTGALDIISKEMTKEAEASKKRQDKYLAKYSK